MAAIATVYSLLMYLPYCFIMSGSKAVMGILHNPAAICTLFIPGFFCSVVHLPSPDLLSCLLSLSYSPKQTGYLLLVTFRPKAKVTTSDHARHFSHWCYICKVAKVVHGSSSHNQCNWADIQPCILLLELYYVVYIVYTSKQPAPIPT